MGKEGRFEKHTEMPETRRLKSKKLFKNKTMREIVKKTYLTNFS